MSALFDKLKDEELDVLVKYKQGEKLDDNTLNGLSDDALDAMLEIKQSKSSSGVTPMPSAKPGDGLDHSLPEGFGTDEYAKQEKKMAEEKGGFWDGLKQGLKNSPVLKVIDDAVNIVSPVEVEISDRPDTVRKSMDRAIDNIGDENDVGFDVYNQIGLLSKTASGLHDLGMGEASKEDIDTYNENMSRLMVDKMGYKDLLFDDDSGKYYVETQDGQYKQLGKNTIKTILGEVFGDKAEIVGSIVGAKKGYDFGKAAGWKGKLMGALGGGAAGASLGNVTDQLAGAIETGEKLNMQQRLDEIGKSAALDTAGAMVGGAIIKTAGTVIKVPGIVSKKVYGHIANGNIDGARKILKSDLGIDDAYIDDALEQMQKSQQEVYTTERNIVDDALETARNGDIKGAVKQLGDGALDTLGDAQQKEEFLAAAMKHPQGDKLVKEALNANPKGAFELEKSIDTRAKQVNDTLEGISGTEAKEAVERYEERIHTQYGDMRETFSDAFKETGYRFDLEDLKLDDTLDDLEKRVTDPYVKDKFNAMTGAVKNIIDGSKSGLGVERNVDSLLDIRQMMNRFYRKNKNIFELRPDKKKFFEMVKSVDMEIERAMDEYLTPEIKKEMLDYFDKARADYKAMYDVQDSNLYKALMAEGKSTEERVTALLKNAKGDSNELQQLLGKLDGGEASKVEDTLVQSIVKKYTKGTESQMQSIDYAKALDDLKELRPFLKSEGAKQSIDLVEDIYSKFRHDFDLAKSVKSVGENVDSGGIGSTVSGRLAVAAASKIFRYVMTLIPWGETPKRLALYRHIGSSLKKSRTPVDMAKRLQDSPSLLPHQRAHLKELIKVNNAASKADSEAKAQRVAKQMQEVEESIVKQQEEKVRALTEFKTPDISELRAVGQLAGDDSTATLARSIRAIQEGKATEVDIKRYLDAKEGIEPKRLEKGIEKERVNNLSVKYRGVGDEEIAKISQLRDYLMSHDDMKYGNEFNAQKVKALLYDLKTQGKPRSTAYDKMYDELMEMHKELEPRIDEAYGTGAKVTDEPVGADGNPIFMKGVDHLIAGGAAGIERDEEGNITLDPQKFILGLGGYATVKAALKNPRVQHEMKGLLDHGLKQYEGSLFDARANLFGGEMATGFKDAVKFSDTADKQVKFWIDDANAKLNNDLFSEEGVKKIVGAKEKSIALDDLIDHEALFKEYPDLKEYQVFIDDLGNTHGIHDTASDTITLDSKLLLKAVDGDNEAFSTMLHEIQHAIQKREGFARGASIEEYKIPNFSEKVTRTLRNIDSADQKLYDFEAKHGSTTEEISKLSEDLKDEYMELIESRLKYQKKLEKLEPGLDPKSSYMRTSGEQESRAVQAKLKYPDLDPYQALIKEEGGLDEPIVKFGKGVSENRVYHASSKEMGDLTDDKILWTSENQNYANKHASSETGRLYEIDIDGLNVLDGYSEEGKKILQEANKKADEPMSTLLNDDGGVTSFAIQDMKVVKHLRSLGYDAVRTSDSARGEAPVIGIISPDKVKSMNEKIGDGVPSSVQKKGLLERMKDRPKGKKVYHPFSEKNYIYDEASNTAYFQRANGTWRESPNEELKKDLKYIGEHGVNKFRESKLSEDELLNKRMREAEMKQLEKDRESTYKMAHTAPTEEYGARGDDISEVFSNDIYSRDAVRLFGHGGSSTNIDREAIEIIKKMKGNPEREVTIYRAVPKNIKEINNGDWISITKDYAKGHGEGPMGGDYKIIKKKVKAKELYTDGNSIHEWGYSTKEAK